MTQPVSKAYNNVYSGLVAPVWGNDLSKEVCGHVSMPPLCDSMCHMCENLKTAEKMSPVQHQEKKVIIRPEFSKRC